jgi:hypothetical protein
VPDNIELRNFEKFESVSEEEPTLKTSRGPWAKFVIGDLRRESFDSLLASVERIWQEMDWGHKNVALAYPIALAEAGAKTISLSSSHIIMRDASANDILRWILRLWERKNELYGEENVGSLIALNVKYLFHVKDAKRVFYDSKIREVGAVPTNIETDPNEYFKVEHSRTTSHLYFLQFTGFDNPVEQFVMAAEMYVFSFGTSTFADIRERGEKILREGFGLHGDFQSAVPKGPHSYPKRRGVQKAPLRGICSLEALGRDTCLMYRTDSSLYFMGKTKKSCPRMRYGLVTFKKWMLLKVSYLSI